MAYKVYYEDLDRLQTVVNSKMDEGLKNLHEKIVKLIDTLKSMQGASINRIANYLDEVHIKLLLEPIITLPLNVLEPIQKYYEGYRTYVDPGNGDPDTRYTTIIYEEIGKNYHIWKELDSLRGDVSSLVNQAEAELSKIKKEGISVTAKLNKDDFLRHIDESQQFMANLNANVEAFENLQKGNLDEINEKIRLIKVLLSEREEWVRQNQTTDYASGTAFESSASHELLVINQILTEETEQFLQSEDYQEMHAYVEERERSIQKEEMEQRQKEMAWVGVGVSVLCTVANVAASVCLGPVGGAVVGAVTGALESAVNGLVDNYVKTGDATEGMDWGEFAKGVLVSSAVGAVSGAFAGGETNLLASPLKNAGKAVVKSVAKNGTEFIINATWDTVDMITGNLTVEEAMGNIKDYAKKFIVSSAKDAAGEYAKGLFLTTVGVPSSKTSALDKVLTDIESATVKEMAETTVAIASDLIFNDEDKGFLEICTDRFGDMVKGIVTKTTSTILSETINLGDDKSIIISKTVDNAENIVSSTLGDIAEDIYKDMADGDISVDFEDIFDNAGEHLKDNSKDAVKKTIEGVIEDGVKGVASNTEIAKEKQRNQLDMSDGTKDGKVDMVRVGQSNSAKYVTKRDYDTANEMAGKGAYRNQTANDILGVDTKDKSSHTKTIDVNEVGTKDENQKYTKDGKYTYMRNSDKGKSK